MPRDWSALYALQDEVLALLAPIDQGFYLTGGTALGRGYFEHRYSKMRKCFAAACRRCSGSKPRNQTNFGAALKA